MRRGADRARRARGRHRALTSLTTTSASGPGARRFAQHGVCQCLRSSTADSPAPPATPPHALCRPGSRGRSPGTGRPWWRVHPRPAAPRSRSRPVPSRSAGGEATAAADGAARRSPAPGHAASLRRSEQPELVAVHPAHLIVIQCHTTDPAVDGESSRLRFDLLGGEHPADRRQQRVPVEQFEIAGELLDAVDLAAPFDLDGDRTARSRRGTAGRPGRWRSCTRGAPVCSRHRATRRARPAASAGAPRRRP